MTTVAQCRACRSERRSEIDQAIREGASVRAVASRFGLSNTSVFRHRGHDVLGPRPLSEAELAPKRNTAEPIPEAEQQPEQQAEHPGEALEVLPGTTSVEADEPDAAGLTLKQRAALAVLLQGGQQKQAAKVACCSPAAVCTWMAEGTAFRREYDRLVEAYNRTLQRKLESVAHRSLRVVGKELEGDKPLDAAKVGLTAWGRRSEAKKDPTPSAAVPWLVLPADARIFLTRTLSIPAGPIMDAETVPPEAE